MIKKLINDLAFDHITLSQALTRAKLIEKRVKNDTLKNWLKKELEGYEYDDSSLPEYRIIFNQIYLTAEFPFGRTERFPILLPDDFNERSKEIVNFYKVLEPIAIVETHIGIFEEAKGYIELPEVQVEALRGLYIDQVRAQGGVIKRGTREVGKVNFQNVIEQTKQKLLDILMQLNDEFPNLEDEYNNNSSKDRETVQNIVTNNIYGNNNPTNIAIGDDNDLKIEYQSIDEQTEKELKQLGLLTEEIESLKEILNSTKKNDSTFSKKILNWLGSVSSSIAGRGLYENIPQLTEFVQNMI